MVPKKYFHIERFYIYLLFVYLWCAPETTRNSDEDKTPIEKKILRWSGVEIFGHFEKQWMRIKMFG